MKTLFQFLAGKKTYIIAFAGAIYGTGVQLGCWPHLPFVDLLLASAGAATLRHGIETSKPNSNS